MTTKYNGFTVLVVYARHEVILRFRT